MTKEFWKGLAMTIVGVIVTFITIVPIQWAIMAVTVIGTVFIYFGKNAWIPQLRSASKAWRLDAKNFFSALLILIGTGILDAIGMIVIDGKIVWITLLKIIGGVTLTYIGGTWLTPPNTNLLKAKK
jgi:hypothetical protein